MTIINVYVPNNRASDTWSKNRKLKDEIDNSRIIADFNVPFSIIHWLCRQKNNKDTED